MVALKPCSVGAITLFINMKERQGLSDKCTYKARARASEREGEREREDGVR